MNRKRKEDECYYDYKFNQLVEAEDQEKKVSGRLFYSNGKIPYVKGKPSRKA